MKLRRNEDSNTALESCSSFDSNVFYIDDELVVPEPESYDDSSTAINENSNAKAHLDCQNELKSLRQTMEIKDDEISKPLNFG